MPIFTEASMTANGKRLELPVLVKVLHDGTAAAFTLVHPVSHQTFDTRYPGTWVPDLALQPFSGEHFGPLPGPPGTYHGTIRNTTIWSHPWRQPRLNWFKRNPVDRTPPIGTFPTETILG